MSWMRWLALVALGLEVALGQAWATEAKRPNVLFIAIDDLNDWVICLGGHPQVSTPNIDRLAKRGVLFTNAHCQAPICNPSRVSLLTGVRPSTSGVYDLNQPLRSAPALKGAVTLSANFWEALTKKLCRAAESGASRRDKAQRMLEIVSTSH